MTAHHRQDDRGARERGYALVALLALMTVVMIMMMSAAPSIRQQVRRDLELEAIARGEEVAEAIRMYRRIHPTQQWPNSMDELLEGVAPPGRTKKVRVLRASAARDPLSTSGEWRTVKVNDPAFIRFVKDLTEFNEGRPPAANPRGDTALNGVNLPSVTSLVTGLGGSRDDDDDGEDTSLSSSGAFVGVASRSKRESIVTYYGIDHHNRWVFTPFYR